MSWMSWSKRAQADSRQQTRRKRQHHEKRQIALRPPTHTAQRRPAQARPVVAVAQPAVAQHSQQDTAPHRAQHATRQTMKRARANYTARTRAIPHAQAHAHNAHTSCTRTRTGVRGRRRSFESREAHAQIVNFQAGVRRLFYASAFNAPITSHSKRYSVLHEQPRHPYTERLSGL